MSRAAYVKAVACAHAYKCFERFYLFADFFAVTDIRFGKFVHVQLVERLLALFDKSINSVQGYSAVITDNAAAPVGIGKPRNNTRFSDGPHVFGISRKNAVVVRFAVLGKNLLRYRIGRKTVGFQRLFDHAPAAFGVNAAFKRRIRLQADDNFVFFRNIAGPVGVYALRYFYFGIVHASFRFLFEHLFKLVPYGKRALRGSLQKGIVSRVRCIIMLNKVAYVDFRAPIFALKILKIVRVDIHVGTPSHKIHII